MQGMLENQLLNLDIHSNRNGSEANSNELEDENDIDDYSMHSVTNNSTAAIHRPIRKNANNDSTAPQSNVPCGVSIESLNSSNNSRRRQLPQIPLEKQQASREKSK